MDREERTEVVRAAYAAYAIGERDALWALLAPEVTFHVAGDHPLSGDYRGLEAVCGYLDAVDRVTGSLGSTTLETVFADESGDMVLVESTTRRGSVERVIGHVLRFKGHRLVEMWDNPADPEAEDRFWRRHVPAQRRRNLPNVASAGAGLRAEAAPAPPPG